MKGFGFHVQKKDLLNNDKFHFGGNVSQLLDSGCDTFQIFLGSNIQKFKNTDLIKQTQQIRALNHHISQDKDINVFVHSQYSLNIANPEQLEQNVQQIVALMKEMFVYNLIIASSIGNDKNIKEKCKQSEEYKSNMRNRMKLFKGLVLHTGYNADQQQGKDIVIKTILLSLQNIQHDFYELLQISNIEQQQVADFYNIIPNMQQMQQKYKKIHPSFPYLILETSAGQKNSMLNDLNEFFDIYKSISINKFNDNIFKFCIDTCHIYQAKQLDVYIDEYLKNEDIQQRIILYHLNGSKNEAKGVDRHEILTKGHIDIKKIMEIVNDFRQRQHQYMIQEDPYDFEFMQNYIK